MADNPLSTDGNTTPPATEPAKETEIAPAEASKLLMGGAAMLQRHWLQNAVNIAKAMTAGQPVSPGNFDDLRRVREQFEELDRANTAITRIAQAQEKAKEQTQKSDGAAETKA
jgi:hypothetical protein